MVTKDEQKAWQDDNKCFIDECNKAHIRDAIWIMCVSAICGVILVAVWYFEIKLL